MSLRVAPIFRSGAGSILPWRFFLPLLGAAASFLILIYFLNCVPIARDAFASGNRAFLANLTWLPSSFVGTYKMAHMLENERYDVVLFGNSHVQEVSAQYLGRFGRFFNMSTPASTFRQSANYIEALKAAGRAPNIAVIGAPNFNRMMQASAYWPPPPRRWLIELGDCAAYLRGELSFHDFAGVMWRHVREELHLAKVGFSLRVATSHISAIFSTMPDRHLAYGDDGHLARAARTAGKQLPIAGKGRAGDTILITIMIEDLLRIRSAMAGSTVVIYEDPTHPDSMRYFEQHPTVAATKARAEFFAACEKVAIVCLPAPLLDGPSAEGWADEVHPPGDLLGPWLTAQLERVRAR